MAVANGGIKGSTLPVSNTINSNTDFVYGLGNNGHTAVRFPISLFVISGAQDIAFDPGDSGLTSNNLQDAILEIKTLIDNLG